MTRQMTKRLDAIERRIKGPEGQWIRLYDDQPDYEERLEEALRNGNNIIVRQFVIPKDNSDADS